MSYSGTFRIPDTPTTATVIAGSLSTTVNSPFRGISAQDGYGIMHYVTGITSSTFVINLSDIQFVDAVFAILRD